MIRVVNTRTKKTVIAKDGKDVARLWRVERDRRLSEPVTQAKSS